MAGRYRRPVTAEQKEKAAQARDAKLAGLHKTLTEQVTALADGPQWRAWLAFAGRFHQYSFNNTALLMAQNPNATQVGGYNLWQQLGRQVSKGEKGLMVLAPVTRKLEPAAAQPVPAAPATPATDTTTDGAGARHAVVGYRPVYVWDVSQTTGDPLPSPPRPQLLAGQAPGGLWDALTAQCETAGLTVARQPIAGDLGPNGYTSFDDREIVVRADVDDAQAVKTLAHELGHALLHDPATFAGGTTTGCRGTQEVEAESLAFLVSAEHGLDSSDYTFAYIAGWARQAAAGEGGDVEKVIRDTATRVLATARQVLAATHAELHPPSEQELAAATQAADELTTRVRDGVQRTSDLRELASPSAQPAPPPTPPTGPASVVEAQRERLVAVNAAAVEHYAAQYASSWAPGYLQQRLGVDLVADAASTLPRVGYAPPGWKNLTEHLHRQGFADDEILTAGLGITARTGQVVDRFRDRLMFPIRDHPAGDVVGFVGRRNPAEDSAAAAGAEQNPKYLNTGHTPLYSKGEHLFGLAEAADVLSHGGTAVLVEGPVDALAVDVAGGGALAGVSPLGTALTHPHAVLLRAVLPVGSDRVVVATDADQAGRDAAVRAYQVLTAHLLDPRGANLTDGLDPARVLELYGADRLADQLTKADPMARQLVETALSGRDLTWAEDRVAAARDAASIISQAPADTWQREAAAVATSTGLDPGLLTEVLIEAVRVGDDAVGRLTARDRRDDLDRGQHLPPTAADIAAMSFPNPLPARVTPWRPRTDPSATPITAATAAPQRGPHR